MFAISITGLIPDPKSQTVRFGFTLTTELGTVYQFSSTDRFKIDSWVDSITKQKNNIEAAINDIVM